MPSHGNNEYVNELREKRDDTDEAQKVIQIVYKYEELLNNN